MRNDYCGCSAGGLSALDEAMTYEPADPSGRNLTDDTRPHPRGWTYGVAGNDPKPTDTGRPKPPRKGRTGFPGRVRPAA
jgi:hypothetical protein